MHERDGEPRELSERAEKLLFDVAHKEQASDFRLLSEILHDEVDRLEKLSTGETELTDLESAKFGCTHADCAAYLMLNWGFPDDLICCALLHHRPTQIWANDLIQQWRNDNLRCDWIIGILLFDS